MKIHVIAVLLGLAACKDDKKAPAAPTQTFAEAMALICGAAERPEMKSVNPAERQQQIATWLDEQLKNPEARALFAEVGSAGRVEAFAKIDEAARRAGVDLCALTRPPDPLSGVEVPAVGALPLEPLPSSMVTVIATVDSIIVEGEAILSLRDHEIDPAEKEGGAQGHLIPRLQRFLEAIPNRGDHVGLVLHPRTPYRTVIALVGSCRSVFPKVSVLARGDAGPGTLPVTIPNKPEVTIPDVKPVGGPMGVTMVVAVTATRVTVYSIPGNEGTIGPLLDVPNAEAPAAVRKVLAEVVARHPGEEQHGVLMADDGIAAQEVVTLIAAMRESFPEVLLSLGLE